MLENSFPGLRGTAHGESSPATPDYNCIAWAAEDQANWWWPDPLYFWPAAAPRVNELDSFIVAFRNLGYEVCDGAGFEAGFQKVAIYQGRNGVPSHMARQLHDGTWTSKLGSDVDIVHACPEDLEGTEYGTAVRFLRRPL